MTDHTANPPPMAKMDETAPYILLVDQNDQLDAMAFAFSHLDRRMPTLDGAPVIIGCDFGAGDSVAVRRYADGRVEVVDRDSFYQDAPRMLEALCPVVREVDMPPDISPRNARRLARKGGRRLFKP